MAPGPLKHKYREGSKSPGKSKRCTKCTAASSPSAQTSGASGVTALCAKPSETGNRPILISLFLHFIKYIPHVEASLFVFLAAQSGIRVGDLDGELSRSLHNDLPVLGRHVVSNLCTVRPAGNTAHPKPPQPNAWQQCRQSNESHPADSRAV